jgi:hypothetical protein
MGLNGQLHALAALPAGKEVHYHIEHDTRKSRRRAFIVLNYAVI